MKICKGWLQALLSSAPRGFAARSRVLARLVSLAQIGELTRRLNLYLKKLQMNKKVKPYFTPQGVVIMQCVISGKISAERNLHGLYIRK